MSLTLEMVSNIHLNSYFPLLSLRVEFILPVSFICKPYSFPSNIPLSRTEHQTTRQNNSYLSSLSVQSLAMKRKQIKIIVKMMVSIRMFNHNYLFFLIRMKLVKWYNNDHIN